MPIITLKADTMEELNEAIEAYFIDWHPAGYGTTLKGTGREADGTYFANIWRGTTAD